MASIGPCVMETLALIENGKLCWITQRKRRAANRERERKREEKESIWLCDWQGGQDYSHTIIVNVVDVLLLLLY